MTYDALGRQSQTYLPFDGTTFGYEVPPVSPATPFMQTDYELSPLSRPIKQTNVDGTFMQTSYASNLATDLGGSVRIFAQITEGVVSTSGSYANNTLSATTMLDENSHRTVVYKDRLGRVVLTRKFLLSNSQAVDTYNVYDDFGQLVAVLPPGSFDVNGVVTYALIFQYYYDNKGRLAQKKVPGADVQKFYYDNRDLLVLTQDGNMRTANTTKHLATLYDELGRVRKTGFALVSPTVGVDFVLTDAQISDSLTSTLYYANSSWVAHQGAKVLKPAGATTVRNYVWSYIERRVGLTYTGNPVWTGKQHLLSQTYLNGTTAMPELPINDNDYGGVNWIVSAYDGLQKPTVTYMNLYSGPSSTQAQQVRTSQSFEYDNGQRLVQSRYMYGLFGATIAAPTDIMSNMVYNHKDQQIKKNTALVAGKYLQSTDYAYNNRGWLTSINSGFLPSSKDYPLFNSATTSATVAANYASLGTSGFLTPLPNSSESNPDFFRETLQYQNPTLYSGSVSSVAGQNNGNISQVEWQVAGREAQAYSLYYDDLDRLTDAKYTDIHAASQGWASVWSPSA